MAFKQPGCDGCLGWDVVVQTAADSWSSRSKGREAGEVGRRPRAVPAEWCRNRGFDTGLIAYSV